MRDLIKVYARNAYISGENGIPCSRSALSQLRSAASRWTFAAVLVFIDLRFRLCGLARARGKENDEGEGDSIGISEIASLSQALSIVGPEGYGCNF